MKKKKLIQFLEITFGIFLLSVAYYFFLDPSKLITGGITGITIMVKDYLPFPPSVFMYICNFALLAIGFFLLGKEFALKTIYASIMSPTFIMIFEFTIDTDVFLKAVNPANHYFISMIAGGLLTALGLGICFRNNATTGGMDIVQKILAKYLHIPYSKTMYLTDWAIIIISGFFINKGSSFYGIEGVIYGSLCVIIIGYVVDAIALNAKTRKTAYIITSKPAEMKQMIFDLVGRGVTESDVRGGYTGNNMVMLICTLEKSEAYKIRDRIHEIDSGAFTFMSQTKEVVGDYI